VKRLPLPPIDILKHFVFVSPPSDDLTLPDEKKEVEAESEPSVSPITTKVKQPRLVLLALA
jgi:hydrocephalus-inducing protein